ncbi:MAG: TIGR04255 family protein [Fimbriimonadales bacterium]
MLPKRLKKEPLIEVIWQVQFEDGQLVSDVLPGVLYSELRAKYPALKWHRLPTAQIPSEIAQIEPSLRFAPKGLMEEPGGSFVWQVGERVITLNCRKPYVGWTRFKNTVSELVHILIKSRLIPVPHYHSLRYIDFLSSEFSVGLSALQLKVELGSAVLTERVQMRLEILEQQCVHVLQVATPTEVTSAEVKSTGTVIDIETLPAEPPNSWDALLEQLDMLHLHSKNLFFHQILKDETIQKLEPEY